jgi:serine/threonine-protein kinase
MAATSKVFKSTKLRSLVLGVVIIGGVFVIGVLLMNFVVMPMLIHQRNSVIVPDVRLSSKQQAEKALKRLSLEMRIDRSENNTEIPEGYVISQRPRPNDTVKEGRTVSVIVSLGPRTQRVPELKNLTLRQGRLLLTRRKLATGRVARILTEGGARETVLGSAPGPGTEVEEGVPVDLLVNVGGRPKRFLMPNLEGQDLIFIKEKLEASGFRVSNVRYESRSDADPNEIIGQYPEPGVMIREGDSIELVAAGT